MIDVPEDEIVWPDGFMCIGGRTFAWVFRYRKEFVEFTLNSMDNPTGLFKRWKVYCLKQSKNESSCCKIRQENKEIDETKENEETKEIEELEEQESSQ